MILKPRLASALAGACGVLLATVILYGTPPEQNRLAPPCLFHQMTGLHCPGCGATRAVYALVHLRPVEAARKNILFIAALPFLAVWSLRGVSRWVQGKPPRDSVLLKSPRIVFGIAVTVLAFFVLRNLPWAPFAWLAPQ